MKEIMKANAPEKIYLSKDLFRWSFSKASDKSDIEYIRTDAFIEKVIKFFTPHIQDNSGGYDKANVIENFRNYMKGE